MATIDTQTNCQPKIFGFTSFNIVGGYISYQVHNEYGDVIYEGVSASPAYHQTLTVNFIIEPPKIVLPSNSSTKYVDLFDPNLCSFLHLERQS